MHNKRERLDKILANNGFGSRKDVKKLLHSGAVCVNGALQTDAAFHADATNDTITVNGNPLVLKKTAWIMLNKPAGVLSATKDPNGAETVISILSEELTAGYKENELFPVGRLDIDTEGLLIITSDGNATHKLTSPKFGVEKTYFVRLETALSVQEQSAYIQKFATGIHINADRGEKAHDCLPAKLAFVPNSQHEAFLTISEGKFHQVKRMFSAAGNRVSYLKRIAVGALHLDETLAVGQARSLTEKEIAALYRN